MGKLRLAVFISGGGSNLQAIIDARDSGRLNIDIALVLSNNPDAFGLKRAESAGIPTVVINSSDYESRDAFIDALLSTLDRYEVNFITLAGYLRKIPPELISRFQNKIINIHPGPLPEFGGKGMFGLNVHRAVLEAGKLSTQVTVHFVTEDYDEGAVIATSEIKILEGDTPESLQARVLKVEHELYPQVLQGFAEKYY